jgi:hypothetical protein
MAIQISGDQIKNTAVTAAKIDLTGTFDFGSGTLQAGTPSASTDVANKAYVDAQLPDSFSGGDGIIIDSSGNPDVISVDLAVNPGLQFSSNKLDMKLDGSTLSKAAGGVKVADGGIADAQINASAAIAITKLAAKTISGKDLGTNLSDLTDGNGIADFTFNGSAPAAITIDLDGSTLAVGASGIKISDGGVGALQLAGAAVDFSKMGFQPRRQSLTTNGSTAAFNLSNRIADANWRKSVMVYKNGLLVEEVASSPSGSDQYTVSDDGANTTVTFGSAPAAADNVRIMFYA